MIPYPYYKLIHLFGIFIVLVSLGGLAFYTANGGTKANNQYRKLIGILHGVGLFLILLAGFGMLARLGITHGGFPGWVWVKILLWVVMGGLIAFAGRKQNYAKIVFFLLPILALVSAFVAIHKPI